MCQFTVTITLELCLSVCLLLSMSINPEYDDMYMSFNMNKILITYPLLHVNFPFRRQMTRTGIIIITKTPATEPPVMASEIIIQLMCVKYWSLLYSLLSNLSDLFIVSYSYVTSGPFNQYIIQNITVIFYHWLPVMSFVLFQTPEVILTQCTIIHLGGIYSVILNGTVDDSVHFKCCCCSCCCRCSCRCWGHIVSRTVARNSHSRSVIATDIEGCKEKCVEMN